MGSEPRSRADAPDLRLPERYRIRRHLATGGMASVWCADDLVLERKVAIKVLAERFAHDETAVRRFKREARAAARVCAHAHVATIFDVGEAPGSRGGPGRAFIVMEHLTGGTVADAIRVGAVRRRESLRWLREAASALDFAHERGIVHGDIKPANLLLDGSRLLHVADFGLARLIWEDAMSSGGELFGTAAYLSPEQALGRDGTGASDRYSLAVVAFELLAGERPFTATSFAQQTRQHIEERCPRASERDRTLPAAIDEVLIRGMSKAPADRFATAGEMVAALEAALAGPAAPVRVVAQAQARPGRGRARAAILGVALAALATILGVWAVAGGSPARPGRRARSRAVSAAPRRVASRNSGRSRRGEPAAARAPVAVAAVRLAVSGDDEIAAGDYRTAIVTLRRAVSVAPPGSPVYASGLYDLGRAMVLAGDPSGAVPILEARLKIPEQTSAVRQMLDQALLASGRARTQTTTSGASASQTTTSTTSSASSVAAQGGDTPAAGQTSTGSGGVGLTPPAQTTDATSSDGG
jgi:hypothetical protein